MEMICTLCRVVIAEKCHSETGIIRTYLSLVRRIEVLVRRMGPNEVVAGVAKG